MATECAHDAPCATWMMSHASSLYTDFLIVYVLITFGELCLMQASVKAFISKMRVWHTMGDAGDDTDGGP